ncbi:GNAT family N-acetyltransferase [Agrococcus sp. Marseille-P2731]|uniref:GNAT family N-acetyltransferase n=1 Tax=Agrococcus sp. Marseille-P2731 TaxID=1841862 RepID=UPI000930D06E|nr:GNAT family N-acetyltransferase [Agrococcus sp. Marseille-P2731]
MTEPPVLRAEPIRTLRLQLEPLRAEHADEAAAAFDDVALHAFMGGSPASAAQLRERYARQALGHSPDGTEGWANWMLRCTASGELIGTVQATVSPAGAGARSADQGPSAELAWVLAASHQGQGYAREAATAMATWLRQRGVATLIAHIHPEHAASAGVARAVGLRRTDAIVDGEERWDGGRA